MIFSRLFQSSQVQWEKILRKSVVKQSHFLNKICKINRNDALIIREYFFDNLSFSLLKEIFQLVRNVVKMGGMDFSFQEIIFDRLLGVSEVEDLYPEEKELENNIVSGQGYHVYTACYLDLDFVITFLNSHQEIKSVCDLGSGSGRALFYMALESKHAVEFTGLELVENRVEFTNSIAQSFQLKNVQFKTSNFLQNPEHLLGFDAYYLYDPVGTDDVPLLISYFEKMINDGAKFYILFISGWDDLMLNALDSLARLEKLDSFDSRKQLERYVNFYKVN